MKKSVLLLMAVLFLVGVAIADVQPNVVYIFADDLGYGDLGCYGATRLKTPNIDRLAEQGRRFTDAHTASAVCTPSRYALLTGEYPVRGNGGKGVWGPAPVTSGLIINKDKLTLADVFKRKGYATAALGKWHLGFGEGKNDWKEPLRPGPQDLGFDYYYGLPVVNSAPPYVYVENDRIVGGDPADPLVYVGRNAKGATPITPIPPEASQRTANMFKGAVEAHKKYNDYTVGTVLAKKAVDWITANRKKPFFLYLATTHIHHPFTPGKKFQGTSDAELYGDFIQELDWMVGQVTQCLEKHGLSDNTLVIFTSDNGGMMNLGGRNAVKAGHKMNGDLLGFKFGVWEGGHRVPFIAKWPGKIEAGSRSDQLICNVDMLATFMALTGQDPETLQGKDSVNVLPALLGKPEGPIRKELLLAAWSRRHLSIRKGKWMYIPARGSGGFRGSKPHQHAWGGPAAVALVGGVNSDFENGKFKPNAPTAQLYDLEADVNQTKNLYNRYPEVVREMDALLKTYQPLGPSAGSAATKISSPDNRILLRTHAENGQVAYSVGFNGKPIIAKSRLGVELDQGAFAGAITVTGSRTRTHDETWKPVWGQFSEYRNHYNELTLDLAEVAAPKRTMQVILRAYNDGIAFRYVFPRQKGLNDVNFKRELSAVSVISKGPIAWYPRSSTGLFSNVPFGQIKKACRTPFTVQLSRDCFISLHEAAVVNSSDANLMLAEDQRTLTYSSACKQGTGTVSAWRTIQIAAAPGGLIESSLILNLNGPNKLADTRWIKPGVCLWDWRCHGGKADDGFVYGINTESYIRYIDFAHQHGLAYVLIDAEWYGPERDATSDPVTYEHNVDIPRITSHAKKKGVGIWLYVNDKALKNFDMDRTFAQYQKWGIKGIKHGFLGGGNQVKNAFSIKALKKCAEYRIMYNLHEPNKPTGVTRTYPHYMSREYVNSMLDAPNRPPATPTELCVFPVVHNLAGPVDRSCGLFDMDQAIVRDKVHKQIPSTVVSQAAQCLVFPSGILTLPDMPDAYQRKPDLFEFIRRLPMTYDETKVLEMKIGGHITMARRTGDAWRVAALANESGRQLALKLDFLKPGVIYDVTLYEDIEKSHYQFPGGWNKRDAARKKVPFKPVETRRELYQVRETQVKQGDTISARIAPGGGHCMWIRRASH